MISQPVSGWTRSRPPSLQRVAVLNNHRYSSVRIRAYATTTTATIAEGDTFPSPESTDAASSSSLVDKIQEAYTSQETDGILALVQADSSILFDTSPKDLIRSSVEATQSRAAAAGVINAWMGACSLLQEADESLIEQAAGVAKSLWARILEEMEQDGDDDGSIAIVPDIVTYCLAYHAIHPIDPLLAQSILEIGLQVSKKQAGSKRRKALAAVRRRGNSDTSVDVLQLEASLQDILEDYSVRVLHDTDEYIVISKPSGVACYHSTTTTAGKISNKKRKTDSDQSSSSSKKSRQRDVSLEDALLHFHVPLSTLNPDGQGLVHRLDRGTSGCMIWSKSDEMHARLVTAFFLRQVKKQYTALVTPKPTCFEPSSESPTMKVNSPVQGHAARSQVTLVETFGDTAALVQIEPSTGRRHQVRVHCAEGLNTPVLLDPLYSRNVVGDLSPDVSFLPPDLTNQVMRSKASNKNSGNNNEDKAKKSRRKHNSLSQSAPQDQRFFLHASDRKSVV